MLPQSKDVDVKEKNEGAQREEPSFYQTFKNVEAMLDAKVEKLKASKHLIEAEAKLSLSAILLSVAISLSLVVVFTAIWVLLNVGLGYGIYILFRSLGVTITLLLCGNALLALMLLNQLKIIWAQIGFSSVRSLLGEES